MSHYFRQFILLTLLVCSGSLAAGTSVFKLITLNGPGSQSDTAARYFAKELESRLGQQIVVINAPGGDGVVGMREFMNWGGQCDSMMLGNASVMFASFQKKELGFDSMEQFTPIHGLANTHSVIVVPANSPVKTVKDMVQLNHREGRLIGGSISPATSTALGLMDRSMKTKTDVINYKTAAQMLLDLSAGRLDYSIVLTGTNATQGLIDAGRIRIVASVGPGRHPAYPDVPTLLEQGFKPIEVFYWGGFFVNDSATRACKRKLEDAVRAVLTSALGEQYEQLPGSPQRFMLDSKQMKELMVRQMKIIRDIQQSKAPS